MAAVFLRALILGQFQRHANAGGYLVHGTSQIAAVKTSHVANVLGIVRLALGQLDDKIVSQNVSHGAIAARGFVLAPLPQLASNGQTSVMSRAANFSFTFMIPSM